jgi:hypothetical protein
MAYCSTKFPGRRIQKTPQPKTGVFFVCNLYSDYLQTPPNNVLANYKTPFAKGRNFRRLLVEVGYFVFFVGKA